ncbi:MAG: signal peptidase II [Clostridiales bacterium]|jgi:signal peptidase II|nr:signal peptidase II [Clostridiales bacterium]
MKKKLENIKNGAIDFIKKAKIQFIVLFALLAVDLLTKFLIANDDRFMSPNAVIDNFLYLTYVKNPAAAFGFDFGLSKIFGQGGVKIVFIVFSFLFLFIFFAIFYFWRDRRIFAKVMLVLILAGGMGNLYDRLFLGYVRDFVSIVFLGFDLWLFGTEFAIFNIADVCLSVGMIGFVVYMLFMYEKDKKRLADKNVQ